MRDDQRIIAWHSLVHHSADVAAVLLALLRSPVIASRLARLAERPSLDGVTQARLGALAFLHDIGKANRGFRMRIDPKAATVGHIDQLAWVVLTGAGADTAQRLTDALGLQRLSPWFPDDQLDLFAAIFAHHGRPWRADPVANLDHLWASEDGWDPIDDLRTMREAMDRWFPAAFSPGVAPLPSQSAFHHAFAGLLMLADWLASGSDDDLFPYANDAGPDRLEWARARTAEVLVTIGLDVAAARSRIASCGLDFARTFDVPMPYPIQEKAATIEALCVVLEGETGSGKTEAALWRFKALFEKGLVDGLYFALPTRVAATQMFKRVKAFRNRVFDGSLPIVVLAVPGQIMVDEAEGRPLPNFGFEWDDAKDGGASQARWAAEHPKRFLAAPIVVGTVDQVLMGAIRVKHAHMRGACLLRHLLVVDEVHASDRYMEDLLATLLRNHTAAGGHALLLSATLGAAARARLLGTACPTPAQAEAIPYPALSWAENREERRTAPDPVPALVGARQKTVDLATEPMLDQPDEIARCALDAAKQGAKVLIIRNTVGAAVATARALEAIAGSDHPTLFRVQGVSTVHHGRFAAADRKLLDDAVEAVIGKKRPEGGRIVIGTQTLEVSLDLDADLIFTDLCPADILLQRLGRLHRKRDRARLPGFEAARAVILVPRSRNLAMFASRGGGRHGLGRVYDLRVVEATWRQIEAGSPWIIPEHNRRLVERTTHPDILAAVSGDLMAADQDAWMQHINDKEGSVIAALREAEAARLDWSVPFGELRFDPDDHFATRLGAADRQIDLRDGLLGAFGHAVRTLRIPHFLVQRVPAEAEPTDECQEDGAIRFQLGERAFRYDRFGLERV